MPIANLGFKHATTAQITDVNTHLDAIDAVITAITQNLTKDERIEYGSINEQHKLLANKANDYHVSQPALQSPDVDWVEFDKDYSDRVFADRTMNRLESLLNMFKDFKIVHDYDNYQASLTDYSYAQYKAETNTPGFAAKVEEMKQFFNRTGSGGSGKGGDTPTNNG